MKLRRTQVLTRSAVPGVTEEAKDYQEQLKQMLKDLLKEKEKDVEKPLPLMNQVLETHTYYTALTLAVIYHMITQTSFLSLIQKHVCTLRVRLTQAWEKI